MYNLNLMISLLDVLPIAYLNSFLYQTLMISFHLNEDVIPIEKTHFQNYFTYLYYDFGEKTF